LLLAWLSRQGRPERLLRALGPRIPLFRAEYPQTRMFVQAPAISGNLPKTLDTVYTIVYNGHR
jgi:hypothetical protein